MIYVPTLLGELQKDHVRLARHERERLGIDHADAGAWLVDEWGRLVVAETGRQRGEVIGHPHTAASDQTWGSPEPSSVHGPTDEPEPSMVHRYWPSATSTTSAVTHHAWPVPTAWASQA